jgi:tetratricopeptide (TPR) repeat protein
VIATSTRTRVALAVAFLAAFAAPAAADDTDVYSRTLKATTLIAPPTGGGTGWVVDLDRRLVLTNEHVVHQNAEVDVIFPEYDKEGRPLAEPVHYAKVRRIRADVIDADNSRDLALLRLRDRPPAGVTALKLADRDPRPAERIHSIGNPDLSGALWVYSTGTVRQVYRKVWRYEDGPIREARVIETQSPINSGDSGGPVVNDAGELVGVVAGRKLEAALIGWDIAATEVKKYLDEALPLVEPKTTAAFHRRGVRSRDRGLLARAVDDLSAAHRLDPKSADVLADRAAAYRARKDFDRALADVAAALKIDPKHAGAHNVRGGIHLDHGRNDQAIEDFARAIQLDPKVAAFHADRGQAHFNKGEFERAARSYDEAVRLSPNAADWFYRRGLALEQQGLAQKAEEDFARTTRLDPAYKDRLTLHKGRAIKLVNKTGHSLRVYMRFEGPNAEGRLGWFPETLTWQFDPGEEAALMYDGRPILARRMHIWADSLDSKDEWHEDMAEDTWTAPANGYRGGPKPEVYTYSFNH